MKIPSKKTLINILILLLYVVCLYFVAINHEPWSDEAQAWLIARDASFFDIFLKYARYEGTPILWHLILKFFIFLKLPYQNIYILPLVFSAIGVGLFLFKSPFPLWVRSLTPFTYYVFYQYGVIARSYCLILIAFSLIASFYPKRTEKPYKYALLLIFCASICAPLTLFSGILFLFWLYELVKEKKLKLGPIFMVCAFYILCAFSCFPPNDNSAVLGEHKTITGVIFSSIDIFSQSILMNHFILPLSILSFIVFFVLIFKYWGFKKTTIKPLALIIPVALFFSLIHFDKWHIGIIFLILIFCFWIDYEHEKFSFKKNKLFCLLLLFILILNVKWSLNSSLYDLFNPYSAGYNASQFIKENKLEDIYSEGYNSTSILPYFEKNIFNNRTTSFYFWSKNNNYTKSSQIINNLPNTVILTVNEVDLARNRDLYNKMEYLSGKTYKKNTFNGYLYVKNSLFYSESYNIYTKINPPKSF